MSVQTRRNRRREKFLLALLSERTIALAAEKAGIGEATAYRWLKDEEFLREYNERRRDYLNESVAELARVDAIKFAGLFGKVVNNRHPTIAGQAA
jgi:hypothetical protein